MRIITKVLKQKAVYWAPTGKRNEYGEPLYNAPEEIRCRWVDVAVVETDPDGKEHVYSSVVMVQVDLVGEGKIVLGKLEDFSSANPPKEAKQVRKFYKTPTLNARRFVRTAML